MHSFRDIIALWPTPDRLAEAIGANKWAVQKWRSRDTIPSDWWSRVLATDIAKQHRITADQLAELAARTRAAA